MTDFVLAFNQLSPLTGSASEDLAASLKAKSFEKGDLLLKSAAICALFLTVSALACRMRSYRVSGVIQAAHGSGLAEAVGTAPAVTGR